MDSTTPGGDESSGAPTTTAMATGEVDEGFVYDVGQGGDEAGEGGGPSNCNCGEIDFSYIWVANSGEGTVSKINTRTLTEEGRYLTRPDGAGSPSRTSVSIDGRAVAVANRAGGLVKIWAQAEDCSEQNGTPGIQTSSGPDDVLAWGQDECVAWFNAFDGMSVQRPVAWTSGRLEPSSCTYEDQKVWTITGRGGSPASCGGADGVFVHLVDGATGMVEETVNVPQNVAACSSLGAYGAAVDNANDLWFFSWDGGGVVRVDIETLEYEPVGGGSYGITVDTEGRVWTGSGSPARYTPQTGQWEYANTSVAGNVGTGIAQDLDGRMWVGTEGGVVPIDMETLVVGAPVMFPGETDLVRGISVDIDGFIWGIPLYGSRAYRVDPSTFDVEFYEGLSGAYTYSDMSGGQLSNVTCNPPVG